MLTPTILVPEVSATIMVLGIGFEGIAWAGFGVNHLDIAPRYSSLLIGITNTCATVPNIVVPLLVGRLGENGVNILYFYIFL